MVVESATHAAAPSRCGVPASDAVKAQVLHDIDTTAGCSIKDSFATLDLRDAGFRILFDAEWVFRAAGPVESPGVGSLRWSAIGDDTTLVAWESAWSDQNEPVHLFRPALLDHPSVVVLGGYDGASLVAERDPEPQRAGGRPDEPVHRRRPRRGLGRLSGRRGVLVSRPAHRRL